MQQGPPGRSSYVESGGLPALLRPLFLHGGQVTSQCRGPEEHHTGQPARPMWLWVPQEGRREPWSLGGGGKGGGLHSARRDSGRNYQGLEGSAGPKHGRARRDGLNS